MPSPETPSPDQTFRAAGPGEDTKICPFCAEVIKAAAIKCRYCRSELPATTQQVSPVEPAPESPPQQAVVDPPAVVKREPSPVRGPGLVVAAVVAAALALVFSTLAFLDWRAAQELEASEQAARTVRASVADKVESLLSYDHATFDEDLEAAKSGMTSSFQEEYEPTVAEIKERALAQRRSQEAEVVAVAVVSKSPDEVETLVFVNTISSREGSRRQRLMQNRVSVTMVEQDGTWLVDDLSVPQS